jgi:hypothetical protein
MSTPMPRRSLFYLLPCCYLLLLLAPCSPLPLLPPCPCLTTSRCLLR